MAEKDATTRLRKAVKENNLFLVKRLLKRTDMRNLDPTNKRFTSLAWAAVLGHEETFEFLLAEGHDDREYSKDSDNNTILILLAEARPPLLDNPYASGPSDYDFYSATLRMARLYYDRYPDILDWANKSGKTALHVAAEKGNEELVRMLLDLGADFDLADNLGNTPLHYASAWGNVPIVQMLIERGCQYSVRNNEGFTPSDYAYSLNTKDVLQDTARAQFEFNKRTRRNVFAQAAARGNEWGMMNGQLPPPPPRMYASSSGSVRMRSGSGTSRTTTTSESDYNDGYSLQPQRPILTSPARHAATLPSSPYSPANNFSVPTSAPPVPHPGLNATAASALSPIANRMRERDADAMEKYKLRQRSGSGTTMSTDVQSQHSSNAQSQHMPTSPPMTEDDLTLDSLVTVGSVAPRRRLRPSASAAQLRSNTSTHSSSQTVIVSKNDTIRTRSGTNPTTLTQQSSPVTSSPPDSTLLSTPTQSTARSPLNRTGSKERYVGPPSDYARFPPPPAAQKEPPERANTNPPSQPTSTRRLPFNLLSSHHKNSSDHHGSNVHKRNASVHSLGAKVS
ncbi:ankyrin repeat-containing domain protein [Abortiporus biennis]|nr:ankyrin repeat-containing domain protein [Abortiporus biennis]